MVTLVVLLDYTLPNLTRSTTPSCWTSWSDDVGSQTMHYGSIQATSTVVRTPSSLVVYETVDLGCGLPQGSSLGPLEFVVYAADLHTRHHNVRLHSFADDTQLYRHTTIKDVQLAKSDMIIAIMDINAWSHSHRLQLHAQKSKVIWLGTRQQLAKLNQADMTMHLPDGALTAKPLSVT